MIHRVSIYVVQGKNSFNFVMDDKGLSSDILDRKITNGYIPTNLEEVVNEAIYKIMEEVKKDG